MIAAPQIDYTSEARWRNEADVVFMPEPEEAGSSEAPGAVGEESGSGELPGESESETEEKGGMAKRYEEPRLPSHLGKHVDIYV
jgi:hypothetical protein